MSFSSETKSEMTKSMPEKRCDMLAEIGGILRTCGSIRLAGLGKVSYRLITESAPVARYIIKLLKECFGAKAELMISKNMLLKKNNFYEIIISEEQGCQDILKETGILKVSDGINIFDYGVDEDMVRKKCCRRAFLRGVFLGAGSITDPEKSYHMEMVITNNDLCLDVLRVMSQFKLSAKFTVRKGTNLVYLKDSGHISDFLGVIGAHKALLELENVKVMKELLNRTNRLVNCDQANMDKTLAAAERQIAAIEKIFRVRGADFLPPKLREVALLRLEEREISLQELGQMLDPPLGKSGVGHRLTKIMEIASKIPE